MKKLLLLFALLCAPAFGQVHSDIATQNTQGNWVKAIPGAQVYLCDLATTDLACLVGTGTVQLYADKTLTGTVTQPVTADSNGNYTLYAVPGIYKQCVKAATSFCQIIAVPSVDNAIIPVITCPSATNGALAAWTTATNLSCDNQSLTDFIGNLRSQSYQALGPRNGEVWLTTIGTPNPTTLPANTIGFAPANSVPTPYRVLWPSTRGTAGQVVQNLSDGTDATGTQYVQLDWLTPSGGAGATNFVNEVPAGTVNGSNVTFTLSQTPNPVGSFMLWRNGQLQGSGGVDYTLSGTTITYVVAPITSDTLYAFYAKGPAIGNNDALAQTCTNQVLTAVDTAGTASNCKTITSAYVNNTIALTGTDINTSNQVTVTHLAAALPVAQGGTGDTSAQGNGSKVQLSTGSTTTNNCVKFDANGNTVDSGGTCGGSGGAMVQVETHTASTSATLDFTTCFTSTYHNYEIEFNNLVPATNAQNLHILYSTNGGSTWDSTAGHYAWGVLLLNSGGVANDGSVSDTKQVLNYTSGNISSTANLGGLSGNYRIHDPLGAHYTQLNGTSNYVGSGTNPSTGIINSATYIVTTGAVNAFRVLFSSGNITSGTVTCYGITP